MLPHRTEVSRIAVVTGASTGLGLGTCRALAERDYTVILTARTQRKAEDAARGLDVVARELDVSSDESVAAFYDWLAGTYGRIDVLVNNAGAVFERAHTGQWDVGPLDVPAAVCAEAFDTNTLGAYRMMLRAMPMMNEAGYGRIVNVSSGMGGITEMGGGYPAYRMSKAALNTATRVFAHEARGDVKVNCVCPGWVKTALGGEGATRELAEGVAGIVWAATLPADGPNDGFFRDGKPLLW